MKKTIVFFAALAGCATLAWLGGYDFNERGPAVAAGAAFSIIIAVLAAYTP